jgi:hypothetical protein
VRPAAVTDVLKLLSLSLSPSLTSARHAVYRCTNLSDLKEAVPSLRRSIYASEEAFRGARCSPAVLLCGPGGADSGAATLCALLLAAFFKVAFRLSLEDSQRTLRA